MYKYILLLICISYVTLFLTIEAQPVLQCQRNPAVNRDRIEGDGYVSFGSSCVGVTGLVTFSETFIQPNKTYPIEDRPSHVQYLRFVTSGTMSSWQRNSGIQHTLPAGSVETGLLRMSDLHSSRDSNRASAGDLSNVLSFIEITIVPVLRARLTVPFEFRTLPFNENLNQLRLIAADAAWIQMISHNTLPNGVEPPLGSTMPSRSVFWKSNEGEPAPLHQNVFVHDCIIEQDQLVKMRFRNERVYFVYVLSHLKGASMLVADPTDTHQLEAGDSFIMRKHHQPTITFRGKGARTHFILIDFPLISHGEFLVPDRDSLLGQFEYAQPPPSTSPTTASLDQEIE